MQNNVSAIVRVNDSVVDAVTMSRGYNSVTQNSVERGREVHALSRTWN